MSPSNILGWWRIIVGKRGASETADRLFLRASMAGGAYIVSGLSATFLAYTRSVCAAYFCGTALGCALSVKVIKKFVRQPRPQGVTTLESYGYELNRHLSLCLLRSAKV